MQHPIALYQQSIDEHGILSPLAQREPQESRDNRSAVLCRRINFSLPLEAVESVLDYGCGTVRLIEELAFWRMNSAQPLQYTGVDIMPAFIEAGKYKYPEHRFHHVDQVPNALDPRGYDLVVFGGTFSILNQDDSTSWKEFTKTIKMVWPYVKQAMVVTLVSSYVDYLDPEMWYVAPEQVIGFIKSEFGHRTRLNLFNDYFLKDAAKCPFEYSVIVFKG